MYQTIRQWYRYYFVRKKSPLSYILWSDILNRDISSEGMYEVSLAWKDGPDAAISFSTGAPQDNHIEITVYAEGNKILETVYIQLSYRSMRKIREGFTKAATASRRQIKATAVGGESV